MNQFLPPRRWSSNTCPCRRLTDGSRHHFFGYFDKPPWNADQSRLLSHAADWQGRLPEPGEAADLMVGETGRWRAFGQTRAWNWQQGSHLQWLPDGRAIGNDLRDGRQVSVIHDLDRGTQTVLPRALCAVSPDGGIGYGLDFGRLAACRPVVGVAATATSTAAAPADDGIWAVDLATGREALLLSLAQAVALADGPDFALAAQAAAYAGEPGYEQPGAGGHRFEGVHPSPSGRRLIICHRWPRRRPLATAHFQRHFWDRLLVLDRVTGRLAPLGEDGFWSHLAWVDDERVLAWATVAGVTGLWLVGVDGRPAEPFAHELIREDPHPSFSPDGRWLLGDSYPGADGCRRLWVSDLATGEGHEIGRFASPPPFHRGPLRCDLHPRWSPDGRRVCIDSAHEGGRHLYQLDLAGLIG